MPSLSRIAGAIRPAVFSALEGAIAARRASGGDIVPLHIGDTHRAPPESARYAAHVAAARDEDLYAYGATVGLGELREALASYVTRKRRGMPGASEANVQLGVGATHALSCAARAILEPGDEVLLAAPYWPLAHGILASVGAHVVEAPLSPRLYEDPSLDAGELLSRAATPRTRAIYLITPNNPDGKVLSPRDLASIARFAVERDLWVIADEVYADYVFEGEAESIARLAGMSERTVTAFSFSKSHALAGARVGFVVAPTEVVTQMRKLSTHSVFNVPVLMQRAAHAALADEAWIAAAKRDYRAARDATLGALSGSGIGVHAPDGGVYVFLDFASVLGDRPLSVLLERAVREGVVLAPGEAFGAAFKTHARLCYTSCETPRVLEGVARLRRAI